MKKIITGLLLAVALVISLAPQTAHAAAEEVKISGVVYDQGQPVPGIQVQVECWETGFVTRPITDSGGGYLVTTTTAECPLGTTLKARSNTALNAKVGFKFSTVQSVNKLDIELVDTHGITEYGWVGGILAAGTGAGIVIFTRRRYAQHHLTGNDGVL